MAHGTDHKTWETTLSPCSGGSGVLVVLPQVNANCAPPSSRVPPAPPAPAVTSDEGRAYVHGVPLVVLARRRSDPTRVRRENRRR
ncbi:hypothetical protein M0802_008837 [Mischocyttarus mexicanus]|nr:hypothetical protein M0802_008837 [Mischocyttarus mexicanus]